MDMGDAAWTAEDRTRRTRRADLSETQPARPQIISLPHPPDPNPTPAFFFEPSAFSLLAALLPPTCPISVRAFPLSSPDIFPFDRPLTQASPSRSKSHSSTSLRPSVRPPPLPSFSTSHPRDQRRRPRGRHPRFPRPTRRVCGSQGALPRCRVSPSLRYPFPRGSVAAHTRRPSPSPSTLRKLQDSIADPKYVGVKTSRKQLLEWSQSEGEDEEGPASQDESASEDEPAPVRDATDEDDVPEDSAEEHASPPLKRQAVQEPPEDLSSTLRQKRDEDRRKGKAVARQLVRHPRGVFLLSSREIMFSC